MIFKNYNNIVSPFKKQFKIGLFFLAVIVLSSYKLKFIRNTAERIQLTIPADTITKANSRSACSNLHKRSVNSTTNLMSKLILADRINAISARYDFAKTKNMAKPRVGMLSQLPLADQASQSSSPSQGSNNIQLPDDPQSVGFVPTQLSGLQLGDPGSMVQTIEPPVANNKGSADLKYHIEIPKGRHGIEPEINIFYSSDLKNGLLGEGWTINTDEITIQTTDGIPRYDPTYETETYLLNGEILSEINNAGSDYSEASHDLKILRNIKNDSVRSFYLRRGTGTDSIVRIGTSTTNYRWVRFDRRTGITYYYGGHTSQNAKTVLRGADKNGKLQVAEWKLCRIEDQNQNYAIYKYDTVEYENVPANNLKARNIFLSSVEYTLSPYDNPSDKKNYRLSFQYTGRVGDNHLKTFNLTDARYNFWKYSERLLSKITVELIHKESQGKQEQKLVRYYQFMYTVGAYQKTLLASLSQYGQDSSLFNTHSFDYYPESTQHFGDIIAANTVDDDLNGNGVTAIGSSSATNSNGSMYVGVGLGSDVWEKSNSVGVHWTGSSSTSQGINTLVDISGDGKVDKVFVKNGILCFREGIWQGDKLSFGNIVQLQSLPFSFQESSANSLGADGYFGPFSAGFDNSSQRTTVNTYITDFNRDAHNDIAINGRVLFNHIQRNGDGSFTGRFSESSAGTNVPINSEQQIISDPSVYPPNPSAQRDLINNNPPQDVIRVWRAPFHGFVNISGNVTLLQPIVENNNYIDSAHYKKRDGVKVSIQINNNNQIWTTLIAKDDYSPHNPALNNIEVYKNDIVFFRLQIGSRDTSNGYFDQVSWAPTITYSDFRAGSHIKDVFGKNLYRYVADEDYLLSNSSGILTPRTGRIHISGTFSKKKTLGAITLSVLEIDTSINYPKIVHGLNRKDSVIYEYKDTIVLYRRTFNRDIQKETQILVDTAVKNEKAQLLFRVDAIANDRLNNVQWKPSYSYIASPDTSYYVVPQYNFCAGPIKNGVYLAIPDTGAYSFTPVINSSNKNFSGQVLFTIRKSDTILWANMLTCANGTVSNQNEPVKNLKLSAGDSIFVSFESMDSTFISMSSSISSASFILQRLHEPQERPKYPKGVSTSLASSGVYIIIADPTMAVQPNPLKPPYVIFKHDTTTLFLNPGQRDTISLKAGTKVQLGDGASSDPGWIATFICPYVNADLWISESGNLFGPMFRGWGQFVYNPLAAQSGTDEKIDFDKIGSLNTPPVGQNDFGSIQNQLEASGASSQIPAKLAGLSPSSLPASPTLPFADSTKRVYCGADSSICVYPTVMSTYRLGLNDVVLRNPFDVPVSVGQGASCINLRTEYASSSTTVAAAIAGYCSSSGTQSVISELTEINGDGFPDFAGNQTVQRSNNLGGLESTTVSFQRNSSTSRSSGWNGGGSFPESKNPSNDKGDAASQTANDARSSLGISVNFGTGDEEVPSFWLDFNGDGLTDLGFDNGVAELNTGNGFTSPISWPSLVHHSTSSITNAFGGGFCYAGGSISGGVSSCTSTSNENISYADVNEDGLADIVKSTENRITVMLNNGSGFDAERDWLTNANLNSNLNTTVSNGFSVGGSFTFGFSPFIIPIKFVFNPGFGTSSSTASTRSRLIDINGDGRLDWVASNGEGDLRYRLAIPDKANKLRQVTRPLGGSFTMDYEYSPSTYNHQGGKWVLNAVQLNDGVIANGPDKRTTIQYADGNYDHYEQSFLGFARVADNEWAGDTIYRKRVRTFDNSNYYVADHLLSDTLTDSKGNLFRITQNTYYLGHVIPGKKDFQNESLVLPRVIDGGPTDGIYFSPLRTTQTGTCEGGKNLLTLNQNEYEYNRYGLVKRHRYLNTPGVISTSNFSYETSIGYQRASDNNSIIGCPHNIITIDAGRTQVSHIVARFNGTRIIRYGVYSSATDSSITNFSYDQTYGNLIGKTLPPNDSNQSVSYDFGYEGDLNTYCNSVTQHSGGDYTWNTQIFTNLLYGIDTQQIDIHHISITKQLDHFGRIIVVGGPVFLSSGSETKSTNNIQVFYPPTINAPAPIYTKVQHYDAQNQGNYIDVINFIDGFRRSCQIKKTASISNLPTAKWIVSGKTVYDALGRVMERYYPDVDYDDSGYNFINANGLHKVNSRKYTYDVEDRLTNEFLPVKVGVKVQPIVLNTNYSISAPDNNLLVVTTLLNDDGTKRIKKEFTNGSGKLAKEINIGPKGRAIQTTFIYDGLDRLIGTIDPKNLGSYFHYDYQNRMDSTWTPDGHWTKFIFDKTGSMISRTNPIGHVSYYYTYDRLDSVNDVNFPENNAKYFYGKNVEAIQNSRAENRVIERRDGSGIERYSYDDFGRIVLDTRTIIAPFDTSFSFLTSYKYDAWNRLLNMTYPDGEKVSYTYNLAGLLANVTGTHDNIGGHQVCEYIHSITYDEFEQKTNILFGNTTSSVYSYDSVLRRIVQNSNLKSGRSFSTSNYSYDQLGNITSLNTSVPFQNVSVTNRYFYDELNRLDSAHGGWVNNSNTDITYQLGVQFNDWHGIDNRRTCVFAGQPGDTTAYNFSAYNYVYANTTTHQITQLKNYNRQVVGKGSNAIRYKQTQADNYLYDSLGNEYYDRVDDILKTSSLSNISGRQLIWDDQNHLLSYNNNGFVSNYVYDANGERVIKLSTNEASSRIQGSDRNNMTQPATYSMYINPYFSTRNGQDVYTKHIYVGSDRICSKVSAERLFSSYDNAPRNSSLLCNNDENQTLCAQRLQYCNVLVSAVQKRIDNSYGLFHLAHHSIPLRAFRPHPEIKFEVSVNPNISDQPSETDATLTASEGLRYWYHKNNIGSTNFVTDSGGNIVQHVEYLPFGEVFMESPYQYSSQYTFDGKEQDTETGLYYYGARYYDQHTYQWLGIDPMASKYPGMSPYTFCLNNPVKLFDMNGADPGDEVSCVSAVTPDRLKDEINKEAWEAFSQKLDKVEGDGIQSINSPAGIFLNKEKASEVEKSAAILVASVILGPEMLGVAPETFEENATSSTQPINRIYSARELVRSGEANDLFHDFPATYEEAIFSEGRMTVKPDFYAQPKPGLTNTSILYELPGSIGENQGMFEIGTRPSTTGNTEIIIHRFFRPH